MAVHAKCKSEHIFFFVKCKNPSPLPRVTVYFTMMSEEFLISVKEGRTGDVIAALAQDGRIDKTLVYAASLGHVEVVQVLLAWVGVDGKRVDPTASNACLCAASNGHAEVVRVLLAWVGVDGKRVDLTAYNNYIVNCKAYNYVLSCAAYNGHAEVVLVLLGWVGVGGKRLDPTAHNNNAVMWAAFHGHIEVVRVLLAWVGVDGQRVDIEVARRAAKSPAVLAVCDEAASIAAWWSPARVAWMISVVTSG